MHITIFSVGTQGDVRPFVALGQGLQRAGHRVRIATGLPCADLVTGGGLEFAPLTADFLALMASDPDTLRRGLNPLAVALTARRGLTRMARHWAEEGRAACAGTDLLLGNGMVAALADTLGEALGLPCLETHLQPVTPCPDIPPMMLTPRPRPGWVNVALYHLLRVLAWQTLAPGFGAVRRALGLRPYPWYGPWYGRYARQARERRVLYGYSPALVPPSPGWPEEVQVTGFWFLDQGQSWTPPERLTRFLEEGPKPIYVGFGSMVSHDRAEFTAAVLEAVRRSCRRAILATGWGGLDRAAVEENGQILVIDQAPHDWLFPRVALAVHHGGAGTTAAAVRAGIPSVVVPFFGDQPFWAWQLERLGVAPPALARAQLTPGSLAAAIARAGDPALAHRAAELGARVRAEDGVAAFLAQLRQWGLLPEPQETAAPAMEVSGG